MVTLTLIQGVVNAFAMFLARILAFFIGQALRSRDDDGESAAGPGMLQYILVPIFDILFTILGSMVTAWFSRFREDRADAGGAKLAGQDKMISALKALQRFYENPRVADLPDATPAAMQAFQISTRRHRMVQLFSTHPPLEARIDALEKTALQGVRW
jgi:heat shock protein HtpX